MKIRWKVPVLGAVHNRDGGVKVGDVMDVDDGSAASYIAAGLAEAVRSHQGPAEEHAVASNVKEERAVVEAEVVTTHPPEDALEPTKRGPGRPRKTT